ncbi:hypothetical protein BDF14DRAFT_1759200 [Spinellus fusiger]|nr:hypothetical protein BDF14DRAFT_1759200 [Spinellus fusiger]
MTKEAREAKKAQREAIVQQRLAELDSLEKAVQQGTHPDYLQLLQDIEAKRDEKRTRAHARHTLTGETIGRITQAQHKMALDQFQWNKLELRRTMIQQMQQKINALEQEYYTRTHYKEGSDKSACDWSAWVPPDRPCVINILFLMCGG